MCTGVAAAAAAAARTMRLKQSASIIAQRPSVQQHMRHSSVPVEALISLFYIG